MPTLSRPPTPPEPAAERRPATPPPLELKVHGLDCAEEVAILRRVVGPLAGGEEHLAFDVLRGKMTLLPAADGRTAAPGPSLAAVQEAVAATGMRAEPWRGARPPAGFWQRRGRTVSVAASALLLAAGFAVHALLGGGVLAALAGEHGGGAAGGSAPVPAAAKLLYLLAVAAGGWFVVPKAWFSARSLRPDMNLLMTAAVGGAVALGQWLEAATVAFLFGLSLVLEGWSVGRARRAVESLLDLSPPTVRVVDGGEERPTPAAEVAPGARFVVRPGERIPLDGEVASGDSDVDQAPITGESVPVAKRAATRCSPAPSTATAPWWCAPPAPPATPPWRASSAWSSRRRRGARRPSAGWTASPASTRRR